MPERDPGKHRKDTGRFLRPRRAEQSRPQEPERGDPRGKPFVLIHAGHDTEDIPIIPEASRIVSGQLDLLPPDKKVLLYLENFSGSKVINAQLSKLMSRGMTLSEAEAELEYQSMSRRERGPSHRKDEKLAEIRRNYWQEAAPYEQEITAAVDSLLHQFGRRVEVRFEHHEEGVVAANRRMYQQLYTRFPADMTNDEIVSQRRAQLEDWANTQFEREAEIAQQIVDDMERTDIGAGVSLMGAWHYGGVDPRIREALASEDDPNARNVQSIFPETGSIKVSPGRVFYPADPEFVLVRELIDGREINDLDILLAYQAGQINFTGKTAEEVIVTQLGEDADQFFPQPDDPTEEIPVGSLDDVYASDAPTELLSIISPQVAGTREAAERMRWVQLQKGMITKTVQIPAIKEARDQQLEDEMRRQAENPDDRTRELRVSEPHTINVPVTPTEDAVAQRYLDQTPASPLAPHNDIFNRYGLNAGNSGSPQKSHDHSLPQPPLEIGE